MGILTSTKRTQPTGGPRSAYDDDFAGPATLARRMRLLLPTDQRKVYWDWLVVVIVLWNVFMIPFSFGFGLVWQAGAGLEAVDWIVDSKPHHSLPPARRPAASESSNSNCAAQSSSSSTW